MKLYYEQDKKKPEIGAIVSASDAVDLGMSGVNLGYDDLFGAIGFLSFEKHVDAYCSLTTVHDQVASESFSFIDKGNYILYNEYIKSITASLGISHVPIVSQEAIEILPTVALNHHISLEGFIGDIWEKIKAIFGKISNTIKEFFKKYFTRLGSIKNKLNNLIEVLKETDKDLGTVSLEEVPSNLVSKFPIKGNLNLSVIQETFKNVSTLGLTLKNINDSATDLAKKDILDPDFVGKIKSLRELAKNSKEKIEQNNSAKGFNPLSQKNKDLRKDNASLKDTIKQAESDADKEDNKVSAVTNDASNANIEFDDKDFVAAKKEFSNLISAINLDLDKLKNKQLVNGLVIKSVKVHGEDGLELETETEKETPDGIHLAGKSDLIKLLEETLKLITEVETLSKAYGKVNETIEKSMTTVDKLIKEIDAVKAEDLGKYKAVLSNKVKERLSLLKNFFTNYNKICKSLFGLVLDSAEGNIAYAIVSLKYFSGDK